MQNNQHAAQQVDHVVDRTISFAVAALPHAQ